MNCDNNIINIMLIIKLNFIQYRSRKFLNLKTHGFICIYLILKISFI